MKNKAFEKWLASYKQEELKLDVWDLKAAYEAGQAKGANRFLTGILGRF
jgi:hypothetical protein